jgi:hypothetical protein
MAKGMFMDPFGIKPETCRWIIGGLDWPMKPIDFVTKPHPANVDDRQDHRRLCLAGKFTVFARLKFSIWAS